MTGSDATPRRKVVITRRERRHDGFLKVDAVSYRRTALRRSGDADGLFESPHAHEIMERGDSVAVLAHDPARDVVFLAEQFRIATYERGTDWTSETQAEASVTDGRGWLREVVAGGVAPGETPAAAARRELLEEIGYRSSGLELIGRFYVSPGGSSERVFLYYAAVSETGHVENAAIGLEDADEDILRIELSGADFMAALEDGLIEDAKTLIAAQWFALHKARRANAG